jgi:O-acetyl-ADP-ribose deacetylase (regulator of RNase III)
MGGGVARAIKRVGGKEIETQAMKQAPTPVGKAVATTARGTQGKMRHPCTNYGKTSHEHRKEKIRLATRGALECASRLKIQSIAFPGLGTGIRGVSLEEAANTMVNALKEHIDEDSMPLKEIVFVGFSGNLADAFQRAVERILS